MKVFSLLLSLMLSSTCTITCSQATDTVLLPNQSLQDGQTLISANKTFELGFFSPGSSSSRYIGIWYHKVPQQTVVWVANRDQPITDNSGTLTFDGNGNLIIIDGRGRSSIVVYNSGGKANDTMADLLDSGNLALRGITDSSQVWGQSFDYPTDTFLPGMKLGINGRQNKLLTSWRSLDDPSPGDYYLGIDPNRTGQFFIWQKGIIYWTSGPWNGQMFSAIPEMADPFAYGFEFVSNDNGMYFTYSIFDAVSNSLVSRLILDVSGQIKTLIWEESRWLTVWYQPRTKCDVYNLCGVFSVCNENGSRNCQCLKGFVPGSLTDWNAGDTGGGCVRSVDLQCKGGGDQDRFLIMRHVQFPENPQDLSVGRAEECELACLRNCTCTAYAYSKYCILWHGNITNLQQRKESDSDINGRIGTLQLRLAASELSGGKKRLWIIITVASSSLVLLCFMALLCFLWMRRRKHLGLKRMHEEQSLLNFGDSIAIKLGESKERGSEFSLFHFPCIAEATANFSDINKLGEGGFGPVYKGQLPNRQEIAVKRLAAHSGQGLVEFKNEILLIAKLQHRNLVRLLGCCIHGEEKLLVYEYMPNKSLDSFIFDSAKGAQLDWGRRLHIIEGIAQGLLYLHKHSRLRVIHRDLKASNVLLDGEMTPKISDFGMARIFGSHETQANTRRIVGTYGYMSPEYAAEGLFSVKSDVFSFGVLLLETVSGRRNSGFYRSGNWLNLLGHSWELWREGKWMELVDPLLGDAYSKQEVSRCIHVALMCVQESAADRPTMSDVITMLSSETAALADPKQPAFFLVRMTAGTDLNPDMPTTGSLNHLTMTVLDGR